MSTLNYEELLDSDRFYSKDEIDALFGSSYNFNISLFLKKSELYEIYKNSNLLEMEVNGEQYKVSKTLLHDLLEDEGMYQYLLKNIDNNNGLVVSIVYIDNEGKYDSIEISRVKLASALNKIKNELNVKGTMRLALINSTVTPFSLVQKYANYTYKNNICDKEVIISGSKLIELFNSNDEEFNLNIASELLGYSKEIIVHALVDFTQNEHILEKYIFDEVIVQRYQKLKSSDYIDLDSHANINGEEILNSIVVPAHLVDLINILNKDPYSSLEIALYLYFEMCEYYSYDEMYYLTLEKNKQESSITTDKFIFIFAKLLDMLGIKYTIDQELFRGVTSGKSKLVFKSGEYLITIDSLDDLSHNDLTSVKINDKINCLRSVNECEISRIKFQELLDKMYKKFLNDKKRELDFRSNLEKYESTYKNFNISKKEKLKILIKAIARRDLKGIDNIGYIKRVFDLLFDGCPDVSVSFIGSSLNNHGFNITPIVIVSILDNGEYHYFNIDPNEVGIIKTIFKETLQEMFRNGYYYYREHNNYIPGIEEREDYVRDVESKMFAIKG